MKKIFWVLAALSISFSSALLFMPESKVKATEYIQQKKKKAKHNYRSLTSTNVTGDDTNADATIIANDWLTYQLFYYRKVPVSGLSLADPFPLRIERSVASAPGFEEEHWSGVNNYFITEGNVWIYYGYKLTVGGPTGSTSYTTGDYRVFAYNGGTRGKSTKRKALKAYSFSVSGSENDADATAVLPLSPTTTYYYRKIAIPGLRVTNLGDYRIMQKNPYHQGVNEEYWTLFGGNYFITDDYLYIAYGSKFSNIYSTLYNPMNMLGDYRLYLYSDGKKKKKKLTKQYVKRYIFSVAGGENNADKTVTTTSGPSTITYYYKKVNIPKLRMADHFNMRVLKKNSYISGFSDNLWSEGNFYTTDGTIWVNYATKSGSTYTETGVGDYQVFLYK